MTSNQFLFHLINLLYFHWSLDSATWEDNLLLQSKGIPHHCPQLFADTETKMICLRVEFLR